MSCQSWDGQHRKVDGRPLTRARGYGYRAAYEEARGALAPGLVLHHTCDHPWCVNVDHLVPMTQAEHARLHGFAGGDWGQAAKTHCPQGHAYDEANTYVYERKDGRIERHCRACHQEAKRRYRQRRTAYDRL